MRWINGLLMSLGLFTAIPMPPVWDDRSKNLVIPALPIVGLILGSFSALLAWLILSSPLHGLMQAVLITVIPLALTGFIHLDGLMDTSDALFSRAVRERKLEILKDSHVGAFAVIALCVVLLLQVAAAASLAEQPPQALLPGLLLLPVWSRTLASLFVLKIPAVVTDGYAKSLRAQTRTSHSIWLVLVGLAVLVAAAWLGSGSAVLLAVLAVVLLAALGVMYSLYRQFGGISGDLSGFVICVSETAGLLALAILPEVF